MKKLNEVLCVIKCPNCGEKHPIFCNLYASPRDFEQIVDGTFFDHHCPNCHHTYKTSQPLCFIHPREDYCVICHTIHHNFLTSMLERAEGIGRIRVVENINDLREKLIAFYFGLDDRVLELIKALEVPNIKNESSNPFSYVRFYGQLDDKLYFHCENQDYNVDFSIPRKRYNECELLIKAYNPPQSYMVDIGWVISYLGEHNIEI